MEDPQGFMPMKPFVGPRNWINPCACPAAMLFQRVEVPGGSIPLVRNLKHKRRRTIAVVNDHELRRHRLRSGGRGFARQALAAVALGIGAAFTVGMAVLSSRGSTSSAQAPVAKHLICLAMEEAPQGTPIAEVTVPDTEATMSIADRVASVLHITALLLLVASAPATASGTTLIAESLDANGQNTLTGALAAFSTSNRQSGSDAAFGTIAIEAVALRLEVDWAEYAVRAAGAASAGENFGTESSNNTQVGIVTVEARPSSFAFLMPLPNKEPPTLVANYIDTTVQPSQQTELPHYERVEAGRGPLRATVADSAAATSSQPYTLTVRGDFVLSVWDLDFTIGSENGTTHVWTGERSGAIGPAPGTMAADSLRVQQAYLFVEGGVLELQVDRSAGAVLYAEPQRLVSTGETTLRSARGILPTKDGARDVLGHDVRLAAPSRVDLSKPTSQGMPAHLADGQQAWIDDEAVAISYPVTDQRFAWPWAVIAIGLVTASGLIARKRLHTHWWTKAQTALDEYNYGQAIRLSRRLRRSRFHYDAGMVATVSMIRDGRPRDARMTLEGLAASNQGERAVREFLFAFVCQVEGDTKGALKHMQKSLQHHPAIKSEFLASPILAPLMRMPGTTPIQGYS